MDVHVSLDGHRDLSGQIYRQVRAAVLDGRLRPGDPLPPTREMARRLAVARNTVGVAYDRLASEGYLDSRVGAGTFVRAVGRTLGAASSRSALKPRPVWDGVVTPWLGPIDAELTSVTYDLRVGLPDARLFPYETWRRLVARELRPSAALGRGSGHPAGHGGLRAAIARHIGLSRGVRAAADDVVVTNGIQQALDLICRVMIEPGDGVAVEDPGYPPARMLFRSLGATVVDVPVDDEGLCVDALPDHVRVVYVTPSHQFPLGMPMSLRRRMALVEWAERHGAVVIEDDYDSEFRFGGRPIDPLQSVDRAGHVIYVGSFSKVMLPSLRIGFLVAPAPLRDALRAAKYVTDWSTSFPTQAALARFIDDGLLARHIRRMRQEYAARHELITTGLAERFAGRLDVVPSSAGLHVTAYATGDLDELATRARTSGVALYTLPEVAMSRSVRPGLVFGYGAIAAPDIGPALRRLAVV
ncbi:PLP-dependent aminotransferase family protein [Streptomyces sp. ME19-01-6]|uniref:MocR-like pyridoxine biosynthesis transcription factor PdxR n=1 Tax=Streptomyces sp. ME19-01-6 TaxID=3028686 RepID=UPI0029A95BF1|nr:PLP-dependent aminotransferase family protein [Streptomyces sp. ME19-01-6]MDX3229518.1 PLP-dependent aminotransferase family protein [Streptomyces sp. ME19-01-6]